MKIIKRILVSPLVLVIFLIFAIVHMIGKWLSFLRYGGEFITYNKNKPKTMQGIYDLITKKYDTQEQS